MTAGRDGLDRHRTVPMDIRKHVFRSAGLRAVVDEAVKSVMNTPTVEFSAKAAFAGTGVHAFYCLELGPALPTGGSLRVVCQMKLGCNARSDELGARLR